MLLTTSCTSALELSALLLDLQPGDTVIVPSFTFTTTALAYARSGARLLFCDIEPRTLGMGPAHLETLLDDSVRAVVLVHCAGVACDVDGIRKVLKDRPDVAVIEDNAHGQLHKQFLARSWTPADCFSDGRFSFGGPRATVSGCGTTISAAAQGSAIEPDLHPRTQKEQT